MKYIHVVKVTTGNTVFNSSGDLQTFLNTLQQQPSVANAVSLIQDKQHELTITNDLLSYSVEQDETGFKTSRVFASEEACNLFDNWYTNNRNTLQTIFDGTDCTIDTTNIVYITDQRWAEIEATLDN